MYVLNAIPYVGKDEHHPDNRPLTDHVTLTLAEPYFGSGMNITTDNFFTSLNIAKELKQQKLTMVGTIRANRREIPSQLKSWGQFAPLHSSEFLFSDKAMLVGYKAKKNKTVFLLSTMHSQPKIDTDDAKRRPEVILDYNKEKGGVDTADQMLRAYSTKSACRRWPMSAFYNLIDIVALNTYILCKDLEICQSRRTNFLISLGEILCHRSMELRQRHKLHDFTTTPRLQQLADPPLPQSRKYCKCCVKNKTRSFCMVCKHFVCVTCSNLVCNNCTA